MGKLATRRWGYLTSVGEVHNALFSSPLQDVYVVYNTQAHTRAKMGGPRKPTETDRCERGARAVDTEEYERADAELDKMMYRL